MKASLLDTDILSYFLNGDEGVGKRVNEYLLHHDKLAFSEITYFEVLAGLEYKRAYVQIAKFEQSSKCDILPLTPHSLRRSASIYGDLRRRGIQIGTPDLLISGLAAENDLQLVTNNEKHYESISGLVITNWNES